MRITRWSLVLILGVLLVSSSNINWGGEHWRTVLQADAKGYHAYLPALVLDGDPNLTSFDTIERERYYNPDLFYDYRSQVDGTFINKYFLGTAVMQLPFFLMAHAYAVVSGTVADGWSKPYVVAVNLAAIAFVMGGLWCLAAFLRSYGIRDLHVALALVCFTLGTNLFYYAVVAPGMSHAYSFGLCCAFLWVGRRFALHPHRDLLVVSGMLLGAILLIRPVNGMILFALPILFDDLQQIKRSLSAVRSAPGHTIAAVLSALCLFGLQFGYYKWATGHWFVYSYGEEGFNWTEPHLMDFLWSYRKGLFVYTPLTLLALFGLPFLWRRSRIALLSWLVFFLSLTYVLSSWWNWWYGGSFGSRVVVEYLGLFVLPFAMALEHASPHWRRALIVCSVLLVVVCQVQTYQARYFQIHWSDMDRQRYWDVFLRIDELP